MLHQGNVGILVFAFLWTIYIPFTKISSFPYELISKSYFFQVAFHFKILFTGRIHVIYRLVSFTHLSYPDRLRDLRLVTLNFRRLREDLISLYIRFNRKAGMKAHFLAHRVCSCLNKLPSNVVGARTMNEFKSRLNAHFTISPLLNDHRAKWDAREGLDAGYLPVGSAG